MRGSAASLGQNVPSCHCVSGHLKGPPILGVLSIGRHTTPTKILWPCAGAHWPPKWIQQPNVLTCTFPWMNWELICLFLEDHHEHWTPSMRCIPTFCVKMMGSHVIQNCIAWSFQSNGWWPNAGKRTIQPPWLFPTLTHHLWGLTGHEVNCMRKKSSRTAGSSCFSPHSGSLSFQLIPNVQWSIPNWNHVKSPLLPWQKIGEYTRIH